MQVEIITKPAFAVIGKEGQGTTQDGPQWIRALWKSAVSSFKEVEPLLSGHGWGLMTSQDKWLAPWTDRGRYLAGWEVPLGTKPPDGWSVWEIPETTYAVVECKFPIYGEVWKYMTGTYLPENGLELTGPAHESYTPDFCDLENDPFKLLFTVTKK